MQCLNKKYYVIGGTGFPFGTATSNSIYLCNLKNLEWKRLKPIGEVPLRSYGNSLILKNNHLYILFGTTSSDFYSNVYRVNLITLESVKLFDTEQLKNTADQLNLENEYPNRFLDGRCIKLVCF